MSPPEAAADGRRPRWPSRWPSSRVALWSLVVLVGLALLAAAVAGALRGPAELEPDSPEGVVQAYLQAVIDGDHAAALGYLTARDAERCDPLALRGAYVADSLTATLEEVAVDGEGAEVRVRLREPAAPAPFGGPGRAFTESFALVAEGGTWRLTEQPWPLPWCPEQR